MGLKYNKIAKKSLNLARFCFKCKKFLSYAKMHLSLNFWLKTTKNQNT